MNESHDLQYPLLYLDPDQQIPWTLEDAVRGTQIFGGIGSGKTSGSGKSLAKSFLQAGYGGLILCAKNDEKDNWVKYAKECGRQKDLIIFGENQPWRFNFLNYENSRTDRGGGQTYNIVQLFMTIYEMGSKDQGGQKGEDQFWQSALQRILIRLVDLIKLSGNTLSVENMYLALASAPKSVTAFADDAWVNSSFCAACLADAHERHKDSKTFELVDLYWTEEFARLDDKTRSIVIESCISLLEPFISNELLATLLTTETNVTPEITQEGYIIILDIPTVDFLELAVYAQSIWKYVWQRSIQRRNIAEKPIPNFLWIDEAQLFLNQHDMMFQTTARSSRTCTVLLSQNISNYYAVMGGGRFKEMTDSLLANLSTKIFHAQNDHVTNSWAADTISQDYQLRMNFHSSQTGQGASAGGSEQMSYLVKPIEFQQLRTGGPANGFLVDSIITMSGKTFADGQNYMKVTFDQRV